MRPRQDPVSALAADFERPVGRSALDRPARELAPWLLGRILARRRTDGVVVGVRLVETEAYGRRDPASHAFRGPTKRNASMFGRPGTLYVYRIHQVHCANVVARSGEAVLLRAGAPVGRLDDRPTGPGRLCRALGVGREDDGSDLVGSELRLLEGWSFPGERVVSGPRVGIRRATNWRFRFAIRDDPNVSGPRPWRIVT